MCVIYVLVSLPDSILWVLNILYKCIFNLVWIHFLRFVLWCIEISVTEFTSRFHGNNYILVNSYWIQF
jgi:hypothetical protein